MPKPPKEKRSKGKKKKTRKKSKKSRSNKKSDEKKEQGLAKEEPQPGEKRSSGSSFFDRHRRRSKDKKAKRKRSKKDKHSKHSKHSKGQKKSRSRSSSARKKKAKHDDGKEKKHWIEEEFLQPGPQGEKPEKPEKAEKPEKRSKKHRGRKKKRVDENLPVMETQPTPTLSDEKKKQLKEAAVGELAPSGVDTKKPPDEYPVVISETIPPPAPPAPAAPPPPPQQEEDRAKIKKEEEPKADDKIYGIKPEKPAASKEKGKAEPSLPLQGTQEDELSPTKPKIISPEPPKVRMSPPKGSKESFTLPVIAPPIPSPGQPPSGKESLELPPPGLAERLRVNIDEILRLGAIMERRSMSTTKKLSFEWIALNRHIVHQQPEAFSSHLIAAVGDVRLEKSLACDALNVLMYQHTVSPDEYLRLCQHLDTVQPITIGLLAQLLRTNTQYYSSIHNLRSQTLQCDVLPIK